MEIYDKLLKPVSEVNYLRAENVERYRVIIRYFFSEYENIHYWLYSSDVYKMMVETGYFPDYTEENCQSDLHSLVEWGNLGALQDTSRVETIAEFKNKKFRYQLNEYTVEIERMILKLENLEVEGASLEPTLLERLANAIQRFPKILDKSDADVSGWWSQLNNDFIRLNQNYQDYIRTLNSHSAEKMMQSEEFLLFKDHLIEYLRSFIMGLQSQGSIIESYLKRISAEDTHRMVKRLVAYELSIPRLERKVEEEDLKLSIEKRWENFERWFIGNEEENEMNRLYNITNDIIRRITRYAQQISELKHRNANRKQEYRHIADVFQKCENLCEAHLLSAQVFGVEDMFHVMNLKPRVQDSIDVGVYEEEASQYALEPHTRMARKNSVRSVSSDYALEKQMYLLALEKDLQAQQVLLRELMRDGKITFSSLPTIDAYTRKMLLGWVSKALQQKSKRVKTEFGMEYSVVLVDKSEKCEIFCDDGMFISPNFVIEFEEEKV